MGDDERTMDPWQWVRTLAAALGVEPPTAAEVEDLLAAAGTAAHASQRWAAPISTWLLARAEVAPAAGRATMEQLAAAVAGEDPGGAQHDGPDTA